MLRRIDQIEGPQVFQAKCFFDERGFLLQSFERSDLESRNIRAEFRQAIQSRSRRGVVRGLHFQWAPPQGKLVRCVAGSIFDVIVDVRHGSPSLGDHAAIEMSAQNNLVLWVPPGFAHGFMATDEGSMVLYECTSEWAPEAEGGIRWDDPDLGIAWPVLPAIVSQKDRRLPMLAQWMGDPRSMSFRYSP